MEQTRFITFKCETQSGKKKKKNAQSKCRILHAFSMYCINYAKREQGKPVQADSKVMFHTITSSIRRLSGAISRVWPVNT